MKCLIETFATEQQSRRQKIQIQTSRQIMSKLIFIFQWLSTCSFALFLEIKVNCIKSADLRKCVVPSRHLFSPEVRCHDSHDRHVASETSGSSLTCLVTLRDDFSPVGLVPFRHDNARGRRGTNQPLKVAHFLHLLYHNFSSFYRSNTYRIHVSSLCGTGPEGHLCEQILLTVCNMQYIHC